jgi:ParB family chromosome partitioning protein
LNVNTAPVDTKRRALGKGLDSLLPRVHAAPSADTDSGKPREIPLDQIDRNPFQTRSRVNEELLGELAASITANGVVQPVLVRPLAHGRVQLIACARSPTSRRWRSPSSRIFSAPT